MVPRQSSPTFDISHSDSNTRKRVYKACDRCRLKKCKCDGGNPCVRCRTDDAICAFGKKREAHDKLYPKGYVEALEQQQVWLVYGLQELYRRFTDVERWPRGPLKCEANGRPLTHDLLTWLGALDHSKGERFEKDSQSIQQELWKQKVGHTQRQDSPDDSSEDAQSPVLSTRFSDTFARPPLVPPTFSPSLLQETTTKTGPQSVPISPGFIPPKAMHEDIANPSMLPDPQQWPNSLEGFDDMDPIANYNIMSFDDLVSIPMFNRQTLMNYVSYTKTKNDDEDIS